MYYIYKDHLGSPYAITDVNGNIAVYNGQPQRFSFDPWGNRRNPTDWTFNILPDPANYLIARGFTGHEHLDAFGLINMNGRVYDPVLGRMLSPDNFVQTPDNSQNFNRYSYCLNNPLVYTDPDGENYLWSFVIGGAINTIAQYAQGNIDNFEDGAMAFVEGGLTASMSVGAGANLLETAIGSVASAMPDINIPIGDNLSVQISPAVFTGSTQIGYGVDIGVSYTEGNNTFSFGVSLRDFGRNFGPSGKSFETVVSAGYGFDDGKTKFSAGYSRFFSGETSQGLWRIKGGGKDWSASVENDVFFGDKLSRDRNRTHSMEFTYKDFTAGLLMYTGDPGADGYGKGRDFSSGKNGTYAGPNANKYNTGAWYVGYQNYRFGRQSDRIRHDTQGPFHDLIGSARFLLMPDKITSWYPWYFQIAKNTFTQW